MLTCARNPDGPKMLTAVIAMTPAGVIGRDGALPWRLRSDLQRFKSLTMGGTLIMGRKTYDSIGRPLPGRATIVITRQPDWQVGGVEVARSPTEALTRLADRTGFVVGGADIYRQLWPYCGKIFLTRVLAEVEGDTRLQVDWSDFVELAAERLPAGAGDDYPTEFVTLVRPPAAASENNEIFPARPH